MIKIIRFRSININKYIFIRILLNDTITIIILYINDILIETKLKLIIDKIKQNIKKKFNYIDSEFVNRILNI